MGGVFANGLEISGKAVSAKTIAAFPDVCMTPPENPATPPGIPVPYPNFAMAGDTEKGTGTVKIKDKTVNLKNKSDMSKTSGDEAGAAAKKGVVSSKNTGKSYFNSWSNDVKFEGESVVRMSDLTTNNHASPVGNAPPWVHVAKLNLATADCTALFLELEMHEHGKSPCDTSTTGKESEHTIRAASLQRERGKQSCGNWSDYDDKKAPCICMQAYKMKNGKPKSGPGSKRNTPHNLKTKKCEDFLDIGRDGCWYMSDGADCGKTCEIPTAGALLETSVKATCEHDERIKKKSEKEQEDAAECLTVVNLVYLAGVDDDDDKEAADKKMEDAKKKKVCTKGVCRAGKNTKCHGCE